MATQFRELKRVLGSMRARIDQVFTSAEKRKLLKDIANGTIKDANTLRAYIGRVEGIKRKKVKEQTATLNGKVIDANGRTPLGGADITIQQTSYKEKTDNSGNFIWDGMVKGRSYRINVTLSGYKPCMQEYQSVMDNDQYVVVKMVELQGGGKARAREERDKQKGH